MFSPPIIAGHLAALVDLPAHHVSVLVDLPAHHVSAVIECGPVRVHPGQRRVWVGERELPVNGKELAILSELVTRCGDAAHVGELAEQSHDYAALHDPGALVRPIISQLRRKIAIEPGQPGYIANVPGGWYRLEL